MTQPINTESIERITSKSWEQWVHELDAINARQLTHTDLARTLHDMLSGNIESPGWWAQCITVAYEQHTGKRVPGQLANGLFELAVSKTIAMPRDALFHKSVEWFEQQSILDGHEPLKPRSSQTPKRSTWRCDFGDGSKFAATVETSGDKSRLIFTHTAVPTKSQADDWKVFWRNTLEELVGR